MICFLGNGITETQNKDVNKSLQNNPKIDENNLVFSYMPDETQKESFNIFNEENIEKEDCENRTEETYYKNSVTEYDLKQTKAISEEYTELTYQKKEVEIVKTKQTDHQQSTGLDYINFMLKPPNLIIMNVEDDTEKVIQQEPMEVEQIQYPRLQEDFNTFKRSKHEEENPQRNTIDVLYREKLCQNKMIEDKLIKVRIYFFTVFVVV